MSAADPATTRRSVFVTNLAWLVIAMGTLWAFTALLQTLAWIAAPAVVESFARAGPDDGRGDFPVSFMLFFQVISVVQLVVSVAVLATGRGLLARRSWARRAFIGGSWLMILASVPIVLLWLFTSVVMILGAGEPEAPPLVIGLVTGAVSLVSAIGFFVFMGWLLKRLASPQVRREFSAAGSA